MLERLASKYGERPIAMALTSQGRVMEIIVNRETRSWTVIITRPNGKSCIAVDGEFYQHTTPLGVPS